MKAIFYDFSKKENSTARPTGGVEFDVILKDATSVLTPVLEMRLVTFPTSTYCYIPEFKRYYFISNWEYEFGLWQCSCNVDVLATYKSNITGYTAFVERSASTFDLDINDILLSTKQKLVKTDSKNETAGFNTLGCYLVRISGLATSASPTGITTYALTESELQDLFDYMFDENNFTDAITEYVTKLVFNPMDYILSIKWFPLDPSAIAGFRTSVLFGWWDSGVDGKLLTVTGGTFLITMPSSTFEPYYKDWRDRNPNFTRICLYIPSYGVIDIPPEKFYHGNGLQITYSIDYSTGQCTTYVNCGGDDVVDSAVLTTCVGMIGYDVQASTNYVNIGSVLSSSASFVTEAISGSPQALASGFDVAKNALSPTTRTLGTTGAIQGFKNHPWFTLSRYIYDCAEYPTTVAGRPLMKNVSIGTLSGYCKCVNASVSINGYDTEKQKINSYLNGGFYIE